LARTKRVDMEKHKISLMMMAGAIAFYVIFGIVVPDVFYGSPEAATRPVEHATAALGQVLRKISPYFAIVFGAYALARFIKELRG